MLDLLVIFLLSSLADCLPLKGEECVTELDMRFDCYPEKGVTKDKCEARGCCWEPPIQSNFTKTSYGLNTPYCYYGRGIGPGYKVCGHSDTDNGFILNLCLRGKGPYGGDYEKLHATFMFETEDRLHVKIHDVESERYEVPIPTPVPTSKPKTTKYKVSYTGDNDGMDFGFAVTRISNGRVIFNTSIGGFIFSDQFLQISSLLPTFYTYGLGEHVLPLKLNPFWEQLTMFARDTATPPGGVNLYGVHPFYLNMEGERVHRDGEANGVFLLNSNAMDVILQPSPAITYRTIGGILDFYIFMGPYPEDVIKQYTEVIGRPTMPPYWSLGFHLCRWGYGNLDNMKKIRTAMNTHKIPQDVQWNDIDYMHDHLDFTYDEKNFGGLPQFVDQLHKDGLHYIAMMDPAISSVQQFPYNPYNSGKDMDIFVKNADGSILNGKVWPGETAFPDFFHSNATAWWYDHIYNFHKLIKFDGLWIDMNEPSNFVVGSMKGCPKSKYETPPYVPNVLDGNLASKTLCMTATQVVNDRKELHYNVHSLYGHSEAVQTMKALRKTRERRSLVISRSSYPGTGVHAGHWLGDNRASWHDLAASIPGILNFNMFGIPLVGADICGFMEDTTEELCSRWMQLGAFYPFMRNHNTIGAKAQEPTAFGEQLITASRSALEVRYTLLPYLYTLLYEAHTTVGTVERPLFFEFPQDFFTYEIDEQFMWGSALLISPVLKEGATSVRAYVPGDSSWFEYYEGTAVQSSTGYAVLPASYDRVNLFVRAGTIVPTQEPALTTTLSRKNPFGLIVALDSKGDAIGSQYIDDGDSFIDSDPRKSLMINLKCTKSTITTQPLGSYEPVNPILDSVRLFGANQLVKNVTVNGKNITSYAYNATSKVLTITNIGIKITSNNTITWSV